MLTQVGVSLLGRNKIRYQFPILIIRSRTFMQLKRQFCVASIQVSDSPVQFDKQIQLIQYLPRWGYDIKSNRICSWLPISIVKSRPFMQLKMTVLCYLDFNFPFTDIILRLDQIISILIFTKTIVSDQIKQNLSISHFLQSKWPIQTTENDSFRLLRPNSPIF